MQNYAKVLADRSEDRLLSPLRDEHHVILAVPFRVRGALVVFLRKLLSLGRDRSF